MVLFSMIDIIPYGINPYVIPMIPLCGNHGFSWWIYGYVVGVPTFHFYHIEVREKNVISEMKNGHLRELLISLVLSQPTTDQ